MKIIAHAVGICPQIFLSFCYFSKGRKSYGREFSQARSNHQMFAFFPHKLSLHFYFTLVCFYFLVVNLYKTVSIKTVPKKIKYLGA